MFIFWLNAFRQTNLDKRYAHYISPVSGSRAFTYSISYSSWVGKVSTAAVSPDRHQCKIFYRLMQGVLLWAENRPLSRSAYRWQNVAAEQRRSCANTHPPPSLVTDLSSTSALSISVFAAREKTWFCGWNQLKMTLHLSTVLSLWRAVLCVCMQSCQYYVL